MARSAAASARARDREVGNIVTGDDKAAAEAIEFALQFEITARTADAEHLALRLAGGSRGLERLAQARMAQIAGNAERGRQVVGADQQHVDAGNVGDRLGIVDALRRFQYEDQQGLGAERGIGSPCDGWRSLSAGVAPITERWPSGGKRQPATRTHASSDVSTCGKMTPCAPPSSTRAAMWTS